MRRKLFELLTTEEFDQKPRFSVFFASAAGIMYAGGIWAFESFGSLNGPGVPMTIPRFSVMAISFGFLNELASFITARRREKTGKG